jgi:hypothetical protein
VFHQFALSIIDTGKFLFERSGGKECDSIIRHKAQFMEAVATTCREKSGMCVSGSADRIMLIPQRGELALAQYLQSRRKVA